MMYDSKTSRTGLKIGMLLSAVVVALAVLAYTSRTTVPPLTVSDSPSARPAETYSAGVTEIIKMLDAQVDAPLILAYIQNSPIRFNPAATELIALKEHGASTEILMALLHHGDELRLQLAQAQSAANPPPAAPAYDYAPEAAYPPYSSDYPDASYAPYPTTYYSYGYAWPLAYWPSVRVSGYGPYGYAHRGFYAPSGEHTSSPVVHSAGSRGSGRSGGRAGGRSR